jgi:hypothetical protein
MATAVFVFLNPTSFTVFVHFMAFLVFVGKLITPKTSLFFSWFLGIINMLIASAANYSDRDHSLKKKRKLSPKVLNRLKGGFAATLLLLVFTLLYRNANPVFNGIIEKINLEFISLPWLFFTLMGYVIFLHLLRPFHPKQIVAFDLRQGNSLEKPSDLVLIASKKKLESQHILGSMVFLALNLLLVFFLATDIIYLFQQNEITNAGYSESVHKGVYALMFSIVCAILLILYFFRGNLNFFQGNQRIKTLTYVWIGLNVILIAFTSYKNYAYVEALGLTYKRIGVFVYLLLTLTGLVTAYIKVAEIKNFLYLARTNFATLFTFLIISATIPWNRTITWYNLKNIESPDMLYLLDLGYNTSPQLYWYAQENAQTLNPNTRKTIVEKYNIFTTEQEAKSWQEYSLYHLTQSSAK